MKIAFVQSHIVWEDKSTNISKLEKVISDNPDVELFLLPEMSFTGFSMNTGKTADHREETKGINYSGDTCVINPNGDLIEMLSNHEGVLKYDFIDDVPQFRKAFPVLQDIKPCCLKESSNDLSDYS